MKPLDPKAVERTLLGVVTDWAQLFTEHRYGKMIHLPNNGGSEVRHPSDFYFLSSEAEHVKALGPLNTWLFLHVKATPELEARVDPRMTPPIGHMKRYRTDIAAFKLIPWKDVGHALLVANDYNSIANPWVCFIPMDSIPEINTENTPLFSEADWTKEGM